MPTQKKMRCPMCGAETIAALTNPCRPFCSDRCKLLDLGEWASGTRTIPGEQFIATDAQDPHDIDEHFLS